MSEIAGCNLKYVSKRTACCGEHACRIIEDLIDSAVVIKTNVTNLYVYAGEHVYVVKGDNLCIGIFLNGAFTDNCAIVIISGGEVTPSVIGVRDELGATGIIDRYNVTLQVLTVVEIVSVIVEAYNTVSTVVERESV